MFGYSPGGPADERPQEWIFPFTPSFIEAVAKRAIEKNVKPEMEIYSPAMFEGMQSLIKQGLLKKPYWAQLVFAPHSAGICSPASVLALIGNLPLGSLFSVIGVGTFEFPLNALSIVVGGHVRVGLEDNYYSQKGEMAKNNAELVEKAVRIIHELGREVATPAQAREMLGISQTPRHWD